MQVPSKLSSLTACLVIAASLAVVSAGAQQPYPQQPYAQAPMSPAQQTTMVLLRVVKEANGQQYVVTPRGLELPVPAPGIAPETQQLAVYRDYQGNYWYNDAYNRPVQVTAAQLQWKVGQLYGPQAAAAVARAQGYPQQQPYPQQPYAQPQAPVQQTTIYQQPAQQTSTSNGSSALGTGLAAAAGGTLGGMMGGMIGGAIYNGENSGGGYYGVPYGTPIYHDAHNNPYYYGKNGNTVNITPNTNNQKQLNDWNKQGTWQDKYNQNHANQPNQPLNQNRPNANNNNKGNGNNGNNNKHESRREQRKENKQRTMDGSGAKPFKGKFDGGGERRGGGGRRRL